MNNIKLVRIDERLIHGQVATAWLRYSNCDTIVVADDGAADNPLSKSLFNMAIPKQTKLVVLSLEDSVEYVNKETERKIMFIIGSLENAYNLLEIGLNFKDINVGNINQNPDREKYSKSIWLDENDLNYIQKIQDKGVNLYVQVVPNEKKYNMDKFLKKNA